MDFQYFDYKGRGFRINRLNHSYDYGGASEGNMMPPDMDLDGTFGGIAPTAIHHWEIVTAEQAGLVDPRYNGAIYLVQGVTADGKNTGLMDAWEWIRFRSEEAAQYELAYRNSHFTATMDDKTYDTILRMYYQDFTPDMETLLANIKGVGITADQFITALKYGGGATLRRALKNKVFEDGIRQQWNDSRITEAIP